MDALLCLEGCRGALAGRIPTLPSTATYICMCVPPETKLFSTTPLPPPPPPPLPLPPFFLPPSPRPTESAPPSLSAPNKKQAAKIPPSSYLNPQDPPPTPLPPKSQPRVLHTYHRIQDLRDAVDTAWVLIGAFMVFFMQARGKSAVFLFIIHM